MLRMVHASGQERTAMPASVRSMAGGL